MYVYVYLCVYVCGCVLVVKSLDRVIVESEFEFQPHYYIHFQTNTLAKGMNSLSSHLWEDREFF